MTDKYHRQSVLMVCNMYHQQQNKWYLQMFLLASFDATLHFSRTEFTCLNDITTSYQVQVNSLRLKSSEASKWASNTNRGTIYFAVDGNLTF